LNAKENARRIIRFDRPERIVGGLPITYVCYHGCNHRGFDGGDAHQGPVGSRWKDIWGTGWYKIKEGVMGLPEQCPLAEVSALRDYTWPDPDDDRLIGKLYRMAASFEGDDRFLCGHHRDTLWEKAYMLVGMENMMVYFHREPAFAREVLQRIMDFQLGMAGHYSRAGVEAILLGDDLGMQTGPLLSPRIVQEFLVPEYRRLFRFYRERGVLISFHSCGNVEAFIETFIDLGVDVLNPVQASANDLDALRAETAGRMALQGAVNSATIMDGPADRICAEARERMWQLGREGGYFCGPDQGLPFPQAHVDALHSTVEAYGRYPLRPPDTEGGKISQPH
jgi:uroporphyrinogen decarboxylase